MHFMIVSAFAFAVMAAFARLAGQHLPAQEVVLARSLIASLLTVGMILRARAPFFGRRPVLLSFRAVTGFLGLSCYFWTVIHLPFAEAVLLAQTNPIFTALMAWIFLKERPGKRFVPAAALVFLGVLLVAPPDFQHLQGGAWALVGLLGALFAGSAYTEVRALSKTEHPLTIVFWFQAISVVLAIPATASHPVMPQGVDWLWIAGVGLTGQIGQVFLTWGLKRVPAGRGTLANPLVVAFGALLGYLVFGEGLDWGDAVGSLFLISGLLLAGFAPRDKIPALRAPQNGVNIES